MYVRVDDCIDPYNETEKSEFETFLLTFCSGGLNIMDLFADLCIRTAQRPLMWIAAGYPFA